jgi:hypothetical protein
MSRGRTLTLALLLGLCVPVGLQAQWIVDLAGAWGKEERTLDGGLGYGFGPVALIGGVAAVEHGLQPGLEWSPDKTRIYDALGNPVDPRVGRTSPYTRFWGRAEFQPSWYGGAVMWDPRNHWALGGFGTVALDKHSQAVGEVRWVHTLGYVLAFRLRFR